MDYIDHVEVARHASFQAFRTASGPQRLVLFTTKAARSAYDFSYLANDVLLFGRRVQAFRLLWQTPAVRGFASLCGPVCVP